MGQLPDPQLHEFKRGTLLNAAHLNSNFTTLRDAVQTAITLALTPDDATTGIEARTAAAEARLDTLERMQLMHDRERNCKEWAPLAHVAGLMQLMLEIRGPLAERANELAEAHDETLELCRALSIRIARLEQEPPYAMLEEHEELKAKHEAAAQKAHMGLAQAIALRHEVMLLRELCMGRDRQANRMEYAPLSMIGHVLQRLNAIEAKLEARD